jgi:hypothetical protein
MTPWCDEGIRQSVMILFRIIKLHFGERPTGVIRKITVTAGGFRCIGIPMIPVTPKPPKIYPVNPVIPHKPIQVHPSAFPNRIPRRPSAGEGIVPPIAVVRRTHPFCLHRIWTWNIFCDGVTAAGWSRMGASAGAVRAVFRPVRGPARRSWDRPGCRIRGWGGCRHGVPDP